MKLRKAGGADFGAVLQSDGEATRTRSWIMRSSTRRHRCREAGRERAQALDIARTVEEWLAARRAGISLDVHHLELHLPPPGSSNQISASARVTASGFHQHG